MRMEDDPVPLFDLSDLSPSVAVPSTDMEVQHQEEAQSNALNRDEEDRQGEKEIQDDQSHSPSHAPSHAPVPVSASASDEMSAQSLRQNKTEGLQDQILPEEKQAKGDDHADGDGDGDDDDLLDQLLKDAAAGDEGKDPLCDQDENEIENLIKLSQQSLPQSLSSPLSSSSSAFPMSFSTLPSTTSTISSTAGGDDEDLEEWLDSVI